MLTTWILLAVLTRDQSIVIQQEFSSRNRCRAAAELIQLKEEEVGAPYEYAYTICVPK
jgi:hypothetical protein